VLSASGAGRNIKKQIKQMYYEDDGNGVSLSPKSSVTAIKSLTTINTNPHVNNTLRIRRSGTGKDEYMPKWLNQSGRPKSNNYQKRFNPYNNHKLYVNNSTNNSDVNFVSNGNEYTTAGI
jgi:hypothetical protein